jgi:hypothetical protein
MKPASTLALLSFALLAASAAQAATISGTVSDRTTNKVAVHDTVVLIGFGQGMQEVTRTTTDEHGHYTLEAPDDGTHLVRVDHEKAAYFQPAPAGAHTVDVDVYDVAEKVKGISTEADVLSMQTDPGGLHVVENYFVKNDSQPALTQFSRHAYEIYLPPGAKLEASAAMGPGGMPVASSPVPVGDPNHYAFVFPVRPGETRFQVSYHLPYAGSLQFSAKVAMATENLVVMLPKTMDFKPAGSEFQTVPDSVASQTFVRKGVSPEQPVAFTVSGTGSMPRGAQAGSGGSGGSGGAQQDGGQVGSQVGGQAGGQGSPTAAQPDNGASTDTRPGGGLGPPIDTPDPLNKYKWWILSGLALVLVMAAAWLLRKPQPKADGGREAQPGLKPSYEPGFEPPPEARPEPGYAAGSAAGRGREAPSGTSAGRLPAALTPTPAPIPATGSLLGALKEALFALEAERLSGQTSEAEYQQLRGALDVVLRQALARSAERRQTDASVGV